MWNIFHPLRRGNKALPLPLQEDEIPEDVLKMFQALINVFEEELTVDLFFQFVQQQRCKTVQVVECPMKPGTTGFVVALPDSDVVFLRSDLHPKRKRIAFLHECFHLLLNHVPQISKGCEHLKFDALTETQALEVAEIYRGGFYKSNEEFAVEVLARLLSKQLPEFQEQLQIPKAAMIVLGYND